MKLTLRIRRGLPMEDRYELFVVDMDGSSTLLDALEYLRTGHAPDLVYRHSCHHGSCGTCSVRVDGKERLACLLRLDSLVPQTQAAASTAGVPAGDLIGAPLPVTIEPLAIFEPLADLAIDPGLLFRSQTEGLSLIRESEPTAKENQTTEEAAEQTPSAMTAYRFEDCIECGCCVSACPECASSGTSTATPAFMGPAALAALRRETINRPGRRDELLERAGLPDGVAACKRHLDCSRVCPRAVYPAKHIELLRREISKGMKG